MKIGATDDVGPSKFCGRGATAFNQFLFPFRSCVQISMLASFFPGDLLYPLFSAATYFTIFSATDFTPFSATYLLPFMATDFAPFLVSPQLCAGCVLVRLSNHSFFLFNRDII